MPTPRQPNIIDRIIDLLLVREPKGRERALLEAAQPPLWVRSIFVLIYGAGLCVLILSIIHKAGWVNLPWEPTRWPGLFAIFLFCLATNFVYREVHRQYGKRALREDQASQ